MNIEAQKNYTRIRSIYSFWGKSGFYDFVTFLTFLGREHKIRKKCVEALQLQKGDRVLDIACGTGRNHPFLINAIGKEGELVGFDYTPQMLERAKMRAASKGWENISFLQGDAAEINLQTASFDGIISVLGFSVIPRHEEATRRAIDLLKKNKKIVICDATPFKGRWKFLNPIIEPAYDHLACWNTKKDIIGTLQKYLKDVEVKWFNGQSIFIAIGKR